MTGEREREMTIIHRMEEIPHFQTEEEEHEFWATHGFSQELLARAEPIPDHDRPQPGGRTRPITVRLSDATISRLQALAEKRGMSYQTLLKILLLERLDEEEQRQEPVGGHAAPEGSEVRS
jgi:hypothetical protein